MFRRGRYAMARKKGKEMNTKAALLQAAWDLFQTHGYENTSVEAIVSRAVLSKGAFFHHFATKLALLDAVCRDVTATSWQTLCPSFAGRSLNALARLNLLIS